MAYQVFDNGLPADTSPYGAGCNMTKGIGWDNSRFDTKKEAYEYAFKWLGVSYNPWFSVEEAIANDGFKNKWIYSGAGDYIQIKEVK